MPNLESVEVMSDHRSRWRVKGPAERPSSGPRRSSTTSPTSSSPGRPSPAPGSRTPAPSISFPVRAAARSSGFPCNTIRPGVS
jgi:hypothetical protein